MGALVRLGSDEEGSVRPGHQQLLGFVPRAVDEPVGLLHLRQGVLVLRQVQGIRGAAKERATMQG